MPVFVVAATFITIDLDEAMFLQGSCLYFQTSAFSYNARLLHNYIEQETIFIDRDL
jgi:hypothetical protein